MRKSKRTGQGGTKRGRTFSCTSFLAANISSIRVVLESVEMELHRMMTLAVPPATRGSDEDSGINGGAISAALDEDEDEE